MGLDITSEPLREGHPRDVDVIADGMELPFRSESFDLVYSLSAFYQFSSPQKALLEFHRVLKVGGRVILFDYNRRIQKRLEKSEGMKRPCWSQWQLKSIVTAAGFGTVDLLLPLSRDIEGPERILRLLEEEYRGQWAIVTGVKTGRIEPSDK